MDQDQPINLDPTPAQLLSSAIGTLRSIRKNISKHSIHADPFDYALETLMQLDDQLSSLAPTIFTAEPCTCQADLPPATIPIDRQPSLGDLVKAAVDHAGWPHSGEGTPYRPRILGKRVILANADGHVLDRGACPTQFWPTPNAFQALNWADSRTAASALNTETYRQTMSRTEAQSFRLVHAVVIALDYAETNPPTAIQPQAVAG